MFMSSSLTARLGVRESGTSVRAGTNPSLGDNFISLSDRDTFGKLTNIITCFYYTAVITGAMIYIKSIIYRLKYNVSLGSNLWQMVFAEI